MRRLLAIGLASLIGVAGPAFAQAPGPTAGAQGTPQGSPQGQPDGSSDGLDALNQAPPPPLPFGTPLLIGGGLLIGGAVLIGVAINNNKSDTTTSTSP